MMCQVLNLPHFARFVQHKQGVTARFWELLAPLVAGKQSAFKYMGDPATPTRPKQKYVAGRGHGKSPKISTPIEQQRNEKARDEEERPSKKGKKEAPTRSVQMGSTYDPNKET